MFRPTSGLFCLAWRWLRLRGLLRALLFSLLTGALFAGAYPTLAAASRPTGLHSGALGQLEVAQYTNLASPLNQSFVTTQQAKLIAGDPVGGDQFGYAVAVDGDTVAVGARYKNSNQGVVYILVRSNGSWSQQAKLLASDGAASDQFGTAVALSADTVVVGAHAKNTAQGAGYVFVRSTGAWSQKTKLTASDGAGSDSFGFSVALSGDTTVIGAIGNNGSQGAAYVYVQAALSLQGNGVTIPNGASTPSISNNTDFGTVTVNTTANKTFMLQNIGAKAVTVNNITFSGAQASEFSLVSPPVFPLTLAVGGSQQISVQFKPTTIGLRAATLTIASNDPASPSYTVALQGTAPTPGAAWTLTG